MPIMFAQPLPVINSKKSTSLPATIYLLAKATIVITVMAFVVYMQLQLDTLHAQMQQLQSSIPKQPQPINQPTVTGSSPARKLEQLDFSISRPNFPCRVPAGHQLSAQCRVAGKKGQFKGKTVYREGRGIFIANGRSQHREDLRLYERYFAGVTGGTFLEMGALDGELYSNSWFFEKELGWRGVMIEGSPKHFKKLEVNRPDAIRVNALVCTEARTLHWIDGHNKATSGTSGAWEFMPEPFRRMYFPHMSDEKAQLLPTVECVRLNDVLRRFGITHVDLFSLDVEGAELSVLKAIDFEKFSASVILVEIRAESPDIKPLLINAGYLQDENIGPNAVFLHPDFKKSISNQDR